MRILHVVVTHNFAGTERYVCEISRSFAEQGDDVTVVGGAPELMAHELDGSARWLHGGTMVEAGRSILASGQVDICHVHLTKAEAIGGVLRGRHRGRVVSTRHIAARRGSSLPGRLLAPWIEGWVDAEVAISRFVAGSMETVPTRVIHHGVRDLPRLWRPESRVLLVLQRLEPEKSTWTAIDGWNRSRLTSQGWHLRIVGDGAERPTLERRTREAGIRGVTFAGWQRDVTGELAASAALLAPAPAEPFGLSVVEAMAAGVPVIASSGGGHNETVGALPDALLFPPEDADQLAVLLRTFAAEADDRREARAISSRAFQQQNLSLASHVDELRTCYKSVLDQGRSSLAAARGGA